ncbi:MAG: hypothetical protein GY705_06470 [Bacteroidetes bacterium]|nr:hypothetical protein [Bacteroidota bacterium]
MQKFEKRVFMHYVRTGRGGMTTIQKKLYKLDEILSFVQKDFSIAKSLNEQYGYLREFGVIFNSRPVMKVLVHWPETELDSVVRSDDTQTFNRFWKIMIQVCNDTVKLVNTFIFANKNKTYLTYRREIAFLCEEDVFSSFDLDIDGLKPIMKVDIHHLDKKENTSISVSSKMKMMFDLVEGVPTDRLKICPVCDKVYIQKTAREKKYCSDYCKNIHNKKIKEER